MDKGTTLHVKMATFQWLVPAEIPALYSTSQLGAGLLQGPLLSESGMIMEL